MPAKKRPYRRVLAAESLERRECLSGMTGEDFRVNHYLPDVQFNLMDGGRSIASDPAGNFVVIWQSANQLGQGNEIYARRYSSDGVPLTTEVLVNSSTMGSQSDPAIAMASDGRYVIVWASNGAMVGRRFDATGAAQGEEFQINSTGGNVYRPSVAVSTSGEFVVTWTNDPMGPGSAIHGQRFSAAGDRIGREFLVGGGEADHSSVAMDANGDFTVAWSFYRGSSINDWEIHARRFSAAADPDGDEFTVNVPSPGPQQNPSVAMNAAGHFVIAWVGRSQNGDVTRAYAKAFSASGGALTDELLLSESSEVRGVKVELDSADSFLAVWDGRPLDSDHFDVLARKYRLTGEAGLTFRANQRTLGHQVAPSVALDASGNAVFTWTDNGPLSTGFDVFARQVAAVDLEPRITSRQLFYNRSYYDGADPAANITDDAAIAPDKRALLPGQTASFANYSSYNRGINGVMIDVLGMTGTPTVGDFTFRVGTTSDVSGWTDAPAPAIAIRRGGGPSGADRVSLVWSDGAIVNRWLEITMHANQRTGLEHPDVFYFGNAVGESGNSPTEARVSILDELLARNNPHNATPFPARLDNRFDYNRDCRVSVVDQLLARNNITTAATQLQLITPGAPGASNLAPQSLSAPGRGDASAEIARGLAISSILSEDSAAREKSHAFRLHATQRRGLLGAR